MYFSPDSEFHAGQAFPGMPRGINPDLDGWLESSPTHFNPVLRAWRKACLKAKAHDFKPNGWNRASWTARMDAGCS